MAPVAATPTVARVLATAVDIEAARGRPDALDHLYDEIEDRLVDGGSAEVDSELALVSTAAISDAILVGLLAVTLPYRKLLPRRENLVRKVQRELAGRLGPKRAKALLRGLE